MQSKRKIERRNKRNATVVINFNPEQTTYEKDINTREDVRVETTNDINEIEEVRVETLNDINEIEERRVEITTKTFPVKIQIKNRQFNFLNTRALFENNSIAQISSIFPVIKQDQIVKTETKQNQIKPNTKKELKLETETDKLKNNDKKDEDDKKVKEYIKDHTNNHDKEVDELINSSNDRDKDNQTRMFPFNYLKTYWKDKYKNK